MNRELKIKLDDRVAEGMNLFLNKMFDIWNDIITEWESDITDNKKVEQLTFSLIAMRDFMEDGVDTTREIFKSPPNNRTGALISFEAMIEILDKKESEIDKSHSSGIHIVEKDA